MTILNLQCNLAYLTEITKFRGAEKKSKEKKINDNMLKF